MTTAAPVLVSAIVSAFNSERFLPGCLEDLERQTFADRLEIIVVDSGSEQNEAGVVREFQQRFGNIRYLRTAARETVYGAWNRGILAARGKYLTNANTDDRHRRDAFEQMVKVLESRPEIALIYADAIKTATENETFERCTEIGRYRWHDWDRNRLLMRGCFIGPQPMWRRSVHDLYGYFDAGLVSSGDYEFWLRISQTLEFYHLRRPLGLYLARPDSIEHRCADLKKSEDAMIHARYRVAADRGEILGCVALDALSRLAAGGRIGGLEWGAPIARIEQIISVVDTGGQRAGAPLPDGRAEYLELKQAILSGRSTPATIDRFRGLSSRMILNRTRWFQGFRSLRTSPIPCGPIKTGGLTMMSCQPMYEAFQPLLEKCRPEEAVDALQRVTRAFPDFARAHNDLGVQCHRAGDKARAKGHYERALELEPRNTVFLKNLADFCYVEEQRVEDALRLYVRTLEIDPRDVETLTVTGHVCVSVKNFADAKTFYARVLEIQPWNSEVRSNLDRLNTIAAGPGPGQQPQALYAEAVKLASGGDSKGAVRALERLLQVEPRHGLAHNDLGVLCFNAGDKSRALEHYEEAVRIEPDNVTFKKNLADFYFVAQQRIQDALRVYVGILQDNPQDVETLTAMAQICLSLNQIDDAEVFYRRVLEIEPWNAAANRGLENLSRSQPAQMRTQSAESLHAEAGRQAAAGEIQGALATLQRLVAAFPDFALGQNDLGVLYCRVGDFNAALKHYERAVALSPGEITFRKNLADLYWVKLGKFKEAMTQYVDILSVQPEDVETLLATGRICVALKQFDDARHFFDRALEIEPWNSSAHQMLGELQEIGCAA